MGLTNWKRERFIKQILRGLSRQRISMVMQPGNVWVIENVLKEDGDVAEALLTCYLRGWVEPIPNAVPHGHLTPDGQLPEELLLEVKTMYRLTEAGWHVINRTHRWVILTLLVASATLFATIIGLYISSVFSR